MNLSKLAEISEGKLFGVFADNFAEVSSGFLHAWSYNDCIRIYTRRIL